jgi:hypothetical protein
MAIAIALLIFKGAKLSREKHIYLDTHALKFSIDHQKQAQIETNQIETVLLMESPAPTILILSQDQAIQICNLQLETSKAMLVKLEEGIKEFRR